MTRGKGNDGYTIVFFTDSMERLAFELNLKGWIEFRQDRSLSRRWKTRKAWNKIQK